MMGTVVVLVPGMRKANRRVHLIVRAKEKMEARQLFLGFTLGVLNKF